MARSWELSADLSRGYAALAIALALLSLALLAGELRRERRSRGAAAAVVASGMAAVGSLLLAVLRPVHVETRFSGLGPRVVVLLDASRSIDLPADDARPRRRVLADSLPQLAALLGGARTRLMTFGEGPAEPWEAGPGRPALASGAGFSAPPQAASDLGAAVQALAGGTAELPQALVVVSDGRLDRPSADRARPEILAARGRLAAPIHTVALARSARPDASVRAVRASGAAVAHQPFSVSVQVACSGGLRCGDVPVVARELHQTRPAVERDRAVARLQAARGGEEASVELEIVLDRAGARILEIGIEPVAGDGVPENDRRYLTVDVARDRVRLLHVAGRPTYDVRALRSWLKSDASVDVVAFFILRTTADEVMAPDQELALIPFPVDELFTVHLPSFDAVILQDFDIQHFDARPWDRSRHMQSLARYVRQGGGLVMVGGPHAFVSGHYAGTPLAEVLPVSLQDIPVSGSIDLGRFRPWLTDLGRRAPVLEPLRELAGEGLPEMSGVNVVGDARPDATVLWAHPSLRTRSGAPMPVLALGEHGSGRSIALGVDSSHELLFSAYAAGAAGRAHGAFWDALLGWLMRDPRFEPVAIRLAGGCFAGEPASMVLRSVFPGATEASLTVTRMGSGEVVHEKRVPLGAEGESIRLDLGRLAAGGYTASVQVLRGGQRSAPTRHDFACEAGGQEWADSRPDPERLAAIAAATGGVAVSAQAMDRIPLPPTEQVIEERRASPVLPAWGWSLAAALCLGAHWLLRRGLGLS
ncbi:MAG: hypothetical protein HY744_08005 [Deltaproteobacteria bacterium]|nr:hypothetical protein [Deltaproteobacteria bacterium]